MEGLAPNTVRLYTQPIRQASLFAAQEFGWKDIAGGLGTCSKLKTLPCFVDVQDVADFLNFVQIEAPWMETGAALQGLAGLQLQEALRLTWDKVDLTRGLMEISGEVKNQYRNRVIPINKRVVEALERNHEVNQRTKCKSNFVVRGNLGNGFEDHCSYGRCVRKALLEWNPENNWTPKDLRNCLPTYAKTTGIHNTLWEQYIGHAPAGVTERHYTPRLSSNTTGEQRELSKQMNLFRAAILLPLETELSKLFPNTKPEPQNPQP